MKNCNVSHHGWSPNGEMRNGSLRIFSALSKIYKNRQYISCLFWHCVRRMTVVVLLKWTPLLIYTATIRSSKKIDGDDMWKMVGDLCLRAALSLRVKNERDKCLEIWYLNKTAHLLLKQRQIHETACQYVGYTIGQRSGQGRGYINDH